MNSSLALSGLLLGACFTLSCAPLCAQPQPNPRQIANHWRELRQQWKGSEPKDAQSAIDAYEQFYQTLLPENGDVGVEIASRVAQLYGRELGQRERALEIYRNAMQRWESPAQRERLQREFDLMNNQAPQTEMVNSKKSPADVPANPNTPTRAGALVELLATGPHSSVVWASGGWKTEDVVWALENIITENGILKGRPKEGVKVQESLAELLAQHGGAAIEGENWRALPLKVQLWLGNYYRTQNDEKAVAILENVLDNAEKIEGSTTLFYAIERLAWFYRDRGQNEKGAQTWERASTLLPAYSWWQADAQIGAARLLEAQGKPEAALKLYAQAARSSSAVFASGAILGGYGKELKSDPIAAEEQLLQLEKEVKVPEARLAIRSLLAWARYKAGDWSTFLLQSEQVLAQYESINDRSSRRALAPLAFQLEDARKWAKLWQSHAIVAQQPDLDLVFDGPLQQPVERRILVDTATPTPLQVTVEGDTARVSARIEESPWAPELADVRHQQIVVVTIAPGVAAVRAIIRVVAVGKERTMLELPVKVSALKAGETIDEEFTSM